MRYLGLWYHRKAASEGLKNNNFDALRLVFASMVVVHHMGILSRVPALAWTTYISAPFAVQAFFVVSGFLVTMSFENSSSLKSYALKRARRIVPAYVAVVILAALCLAPLSILAVRDYFTDRELWRYIAFNLMLSNFAAPSLPGVFQSNPMTAVNGSLWTIKIEVAFYCVVPFIVGAVKLLGYRRALALVFALSVAWNLSFSAIAVESHQKLYGDLAKQLPGQLCFFAGGAYAFYCSRAEVRLTSLQSTVAALLSALAYTFADGWIQNFVDPLAVTAIVYWGAIGGPRLPAVGKRGDFSYGVYLYHFPLIQAAVALGLYYRSPLTAGIAVAIALAACATASWHVIESPALHRRANQPV